MKRVLSSIVYTAVMAILAAGAFLAFPGFVGPEADRLSAELDPGSALTAPLVGVRYTNIAVPVSTTIATADDLAAYIYASTGAPAGSIPQIGRWDQARQRFVIRNVGSPTGTPNFDIGIGDWLLVGSFEDGPATMTWVGNLPPANSISFNLAANAFSPIMVPLDFEGPATADDLAAAIQDVTQVARWDQASQTLVIRNVGSPFGAPNFYVEAGYPYLIYATVGKTWP